jgi:putative Holliday junction resolvase
MAHSHTIVGVDVGEKRIGVAVVNSIARIAMPLTTIDAQDDALQHIVRICKEHDAKTVVVGLPRNPSGQETAQSQVSRTFGAELEAKGLHIYYQDESLTSVAAEEELKKRKKPYVKADIDALAAALLLQDYIG